MKYELDESARNAYRRMAQAAIMAVAGVQQQETGARDDRRKD